MATQHLHLADRSENGNQELPRCSMPERRSFFGALLTMGAAAAAVVFGWPLARYIAYPVYAMTTESPWMDLGALDEFKSSHEPVRKLVQVKQVSGWQQTTQQSAVYVTRDAQDTLLVLSSTCPHLGCSVAWQPSNGKFVCPCHGGCFAADGSRISGPPPRNLTALETKTDNGRLAVRYSSRPS
jgi:menaquinol-cytochrome c reductase iron-sulfur subunit